MYKLILLLALSSSSILSFQQMDGPSHFRNIHMRILSYFEEWNHNQYPIDIEPIDQSVLKETGSPSLIEQVIAIAAAHELAQAEEPK